jgi:hypothetical protein
MTHRPTDPGRETNLTRLAWLVSIVTPVVLIGLLCLVKAASSTAAQLPAPEPTAASPLERPWAADGWSGPARWTVRGQAVRFQSASAVGPFE